MSGRKGRTQRVSIISVCFPESRNFSYKLPFPLFCVSRYRAHLVPLSLQAFACFFNGPSFRSICKHQGYSSCCLQFMLLFCVFVRTIKILLHMNIFIQVTRPVCATHKFVSCPSAMLNNSHLQRVYFFWVSRCHTAESFKPSYNPLHPLPQ